MENPFPTEPPPSDPSALPALPEAPPAATHASATASPEEVEQPADSATAGSEAHHADTSQSGHPQEHEQATEHPSESSETEPVPGTLEDYARRARKGRLNPEEEAEAGRLLKEALLAGRAEVAKAVAVTPQLPWVVTVQATASVWPEIKPTFRAQFLAGLARTP